MLCSHHVGITVIKIYQLGNTIKFFVKNRYLKQLTFHLRYAFYWLMHYLEINVHIFVRYERDFALIIHWLYIVNVCTFLILKQFARAYTTYYPATTQLNTLTTTQNCHSKQLAAVFQITKNIQQQFRTALQPPFHYAQAFTSENLFWYSLENFWTQYWTQVVLQCSAFT